MALKFMAQTIILFKFVSPYYNRRNDVWADNYKFPVAVIDEVVKAKKLMQMMILLLVIDCHLKKRNHQVFQWR